jgi:hypothetical protein
MDWKHSTVHIFKVDPVLIHDLLLREENKSERAPFYMVEVFTKPGTNSERCKAHITETTGFVPAIYDKGTHYVTNMRLTLDILKRLNEFEFVEEITGVKRYIDKRLPAWKLMMLLSGPLLDIFKESISELTSGILK